jgi:hypothetical protein
MRHPTPENWEMRYAPPVAESTDQRLIQRSRSLDLVPRVVLGLLILVLLWQVVRGNLPAGWTSHWPWRLTVIDVSAAAALTAGVAALVAGRRQFAATVEPHLGWTSYRNASPILGEDSRWRVLLTNSGGGRAIIKRVFYRVALAGEDSFHSAWTGDVTVVRDRLTDIGLEEDRDFALVRLGIGAGVGVGSAEEVEVLALGEPALPIVAAIDLHILYESSARDIYGRTMTLIPRDGIPQSIATQEPAPGPIQQQNQRRRRVVSSRPVRRLER